MLPSHQCPSVIACVVLRTISQYTLKREHLTSLSREKNDPVPCKLWCHIVSFTTLFCQWEHELSPPDFADARKQSVQTWKQFSASAINLNSLFPRGQLHFLLFCCTVIFHQDVNLTF